jgi:hypothetical protein
MPAAIHKSSHQYRYRSVDNSLPTIIVTGVLLASTQAVKPPKLSSVPFLGSIQSSLYD